MTKLTQQEIEKEREDFEWWYKGEFKNSSMILGILDKSSESGSTYKEWSTEKLFITWLASRVSKKRGGSDQVKNPKHYQIIDGFESIDIIACSMTEEQFKGFCLGNILKYRIRAGNKDRLEQDIAKADEYKSIFENKKHLCRGLDETTIFATL